MYINKEREMDLICDVSAIYLLSIRLKLLLETSFKISESDKNKLLEEIYSSLEMSIDDIQWILKNSLGF